MRKPKNSCYNSISKRYKGKICPYSVCDYEGEPADRRGFFCLKWAAYVGKEVSAEARYGYGRSHNSISGDRYCSKEEYLICPLTLKERL